MYGSPEVLARLTQRFPYIFDDAMRPLPGTSKPEGSARPLHEGRVVTIGDADVLPVSVPHVPGVARAGSLFWAE